MGLISWFFSIFLKKEPKLLFDGENITARRLDFTISRMSSREDRTVRIISSEPRLLPSGGRVTVADAHKATGVSEDKLRKLANSGKIDAIKSRSGRWLISRDSLTNIQESNN